MTSGEKSKQPPPSDSGNGDAGGLGLILRDRVASRIPAFTTSLDAAIANPTTEALDRLREATDHLMRATARVLIELERLSDEPETIR